ncbi:MAG: crossover junction endodeoxyribonuclease RuvC [Phycisphaerae bacterium]
MSAANAAAPRLLGIDPGLERCGYAVLDGSARRVLDAGVIRTTLRRPLPERLLELETGLEELFREHAIGQAIVEDLYAHYAHPRTAILMGHARGVALLVAARHDAAVQSLPATQIKKSLTGNGHATKAQVQRAVMLTLGLTRAPEPADVADAIAIALGGAIFSRRGATPRRPPA